MSVTPSISSARSLLSPSGNHNEQNQRTPVISPSVYSFSKSLPSAKLPNEGLSLNPDELFTKYTVSEVRAVQHRLRLIFSPRSVIAESLFYAQSGCRCKAGGTAAYGWVRIFSMRDCGTILNEVESAENAIAIYCKPLLPLFLLPNRRGMYAKLWKNVETRLYLKTICLYHQ